ncbi:GNAT family N-acetyltransferase [Patescibacteria group bacterium]|nr:GNAT family N-acetyltransferase [Patescibacteria group bacterium]
MAENESLPWCSWQKLAVNLSAEPKIMGSRVTAAELRKLFKRGQAVVYVEEGNDVIGFMAAWDGPDGVLELGSIWVRSELRGQGLGNTVALELIRRLGTNRIRSFAITTNPACVAALKKAGMQVHLDWITPFSWGATCGPCDVVREENKLNCSRRNNDCILLIFLESIKD